MFRLRRSCRLQRAANFLDGQVPGYAAALRSQNCEPRVRESLSRPSTLEGLAADAPHKTLLMRLYENFLQPLVPSTVSSSSSTMYQTNGNELTVASATSSPLALVRSGSFPAQLTDTRNVSCELRSTAGGLELYNRTAIVAREPYVELVPRVSPNHTGAFGYPRRGLLPEAVAVKFPNLLVDPVLPPDPNQKRTCSSIYLSSRLHGSTCPVFLAVYSGGGALAGVTTGAEPWRRVCARILEPQGGAYAATAGARVGEQKFGQNQIADTGMKSSKKKISFVSLHLSDSWLGRRLAGGVTKVFLRKRLGTTPATDTSQKKTLEAHDAYVYKGRWTRELEALLGNVSDHRELPSFFLIDSKGLIRWQAQGLPTEAAESALREAMGGAARRELWGTASGTTVTTNYYRSQRDCAFSGIAR
ncbi:unnamed protein product [Amoebophrya sp. A120]|nr:unnamed protein product [Amoebophrya sp. A120]|eukprot:GSA120T00011718001.1